MYVEKKFLTDPRLFYKQPRHSFTREAFSSRYSQHHKSQTVRARQLKFSENVHTTPCVMGKSLVFAMTIKLISEFWRNQEIPEKFWKIYQ